MCELAPVYAEGYRVESACTRAHGIICVCYLALKLHVVARSLTHSLSLSLSLSPFLPGSLACSAVYSDVGDGTWGGTNPAMPWDWKGGKSDSGVYDNVLPDADAHK
jgi:hypothetical protein